MGEEGPRTDVRSQGLPFQKVEHRVDTLDAQPSNTTGGILVVVTGALLVCTLIIKTDLQVLAADRSIPGRRGQASYVLRAELPASPKRRQLLHFQRCLPTGLLGFLDAAACKFRLRFKEPLVRNGQQFRFSRWSVHQPTADYKTVLCGDGRRSA
jgi:hypothetical protein